MADSEAFTSATQETLADCRTFCDNTIECTGFSFLPSTGKCSLSQKTPIDFLDVEGGESGFRQIDDCLGNLACNIPIPR